MAITTFTNGQVLTAAQQNALQANDYNQTVSTKVANYVLVAADKGTRVAMDAAGATTITVNTSVFAAGDTVWIQNIGAGTTTVFAGSATVTTSSSLALAQWGGGTLYFTSTGAAIFFSQVAVSYGTATGGASSSITVSDVNYTMLVFNSTATLTVTKAGLFDVSILAGGSGGSGGGISGGSGGIINATIYLEVSTPSVAIGGGGAQAAFGTNSSIGVVIPGSQVAPVAVSGGTYTDGAYQAGATGSGRIYVGANASRIPQQGFGGGNGTSGASSGGGGVGAAGGNSSGGVGGVGGAGLDISAWRGESGGTTLVGGGGGGGAATAGAGGTGGGGGGAAGGATAGNGTTNKGGGGGGSQSGTSGSGGSGVVLIRFKV